MSLPESRPSDRQRRQHQALQTLADRLPALAGDLKLAVTPPIASLVEMIHKRLLTRLAPDFPLLTAICGGGSSGKSTLFNSLLGHAISPMGGRAGMNRRALLAAHPDLFQKPAFCDELLAPFGAALQPLASEESLTRPGPPLYVAHATVPPDLVLLDTPDFDTGARGAYTNRDLAHQALTACDLFIYIFTNATYNNRDNTDFIADLLTGIGLRKAFLVYRVYPSFSDAEVQEHAAVVAGNIFGECAPEGVLGVYRVDEDNRVAAGSAAMTLRPVAPSQPPIKSALTQLDRYQLRASFLNGLLDDVIRCGERIQLSAEDARQTLAEYLKGVRIIQDQAVGAALQTFPMDQVMGRFARIWLAGDPAHIRIMRQTGSALAWPVKIFSKAVRRAMGRAPEKESGNGAGDDLIVHMRENLLEAVTRLRTQLMAAELKIDSLPGTPRQTPGGIGPILPVPPALEPALAGLRGESWQDTVGSLLEQEGVLTSLSDATESELQTLANQLRARMGMREKISQTLTAFLNVLPATVAVTYILHTGDPMGAAGIKVKLSGLFGLHDLYALVALPATSGLKKADRKQLEGFLAPIAQTWFDEKAVALQALFTTHLTGELLKNGEALLATGKDHSHHIASALAELKVQQEIRDES